LKKLKRIDKHILAGTLLTLAFFILWILTLPKGSDNSLNYNPKNLNQTELEEAYMDDALLFNEALVSGDFSGCKNIQNKTMKKECINIAESYNANTNIAESPPESHVSIEDADNYNRAIAENDKTYCNNILDEKTKNDCMNLQV